MKLIHYPNPLRTRVILDNTEKEVFFLKYRIDYLKDIIWGVKFRLEEDPNKILECPNPDMNGKTHWQLAKEEIPENFGKKSFSENIDSAAQHCFQSLDGDYHCGDCTCIPCSCTKCFAESLLGIDTILGLGTHEASKIDSLFTEINGKAYPFDIRTIDEVLEKLQNPNFDKKGTWGEENPKLWDSCLERWSRESKNAYEWLLKYKEEHNF